MAAEGVDAATLAMLEAAIAAQAGDADRAARLLAEFGDAVVHWSAIAFGASAAFRIGQHARAAEFMSTRSIKATAPAILRLDPLLHPLLDLEAFAPRRSPLTLVWPVEAPMIDRTRLRLFKEVRIGSGTPEGSDVLAGE